jgi:hypothetical protein
MYTIYMRFDAIYKFLLDGSEIRRAGMILTKYKFNGKYLVVCKRLLHHSNKWVESPASMNGYDVMALDWEVISEEGP